MKTRDLSGLPGIHDWDEYMSVDKMSDFPAIASDEFLGQCAFGKSLLSVKTSEMAKFRTRCKEFIDRLAVLIVESASAQSVVSKGLYSFCPELMLEGDNNSAFELFSELCQVLERCKAVVSDEAKAAQDEYKAYVIEKRRQHCRLERSASEIPDVCRYLLNDFAFRSRCHLLRIFKLCCLVVGEPHRDYPSFTMDLTGCGLKKTSVLLCFRIMQSNILSADYCHKSLFTESTLALLRSAITNAGSFFVGTEFDVWADLSGPGVDTFLDSFCRLYDQFVETRRRASGEYYSECNRINRLARAEQVSRSSSEARSTSSSVGKKKGDVSKTASVKRQSSSVVEGACSSKGAAPRSSKSKKKNQVVDKDPDVFHKLKVSKK